MPRLLVPLTLSLALIAGCGGPDPAKLIESAKSYLAKDDHKAAILELKTALQEAPESAQARFLLGKALLASGDAVGAELELRKAKQLNHPDNEVVPPLAKSMFILGQYQKVVEQFGTTLLSDPAAEADVKVTLARTYGGLARPEDARLAAQAALKAVPDFGPATIFMARLQADGGDLDGALATLDAQIARQPQDAEAWLVKGEFLMVGKRDPDAALQAYRKALEFKPNDVSAHSGVMTVLLGRQDLQAAQAQLAELKKVLPGHPQTDYFEGGVAMLAKDYPKALEMSQKLLRVVPENGRVLQLAGAAEFETGSMLAAETHLAKALQVSPGLDVARRLLTLTYLRTSQPAKALATLQPLLDKPNPDGGTYALLAQAQLQSGDIEAAEKAFGQAAKLNPEDTRSKTAVAVAKVLKGEGEAGVSALQALARDDKSTTADLPLIATLVRQKDFAGAMKAIDALEKKQPDQPMAANLRARVLLLQGDRAGAVKSFEQALKIQPSFFPAANALALLALSENKPVEAKKYLDDVLIADPKNAQALLALAGLKTRSGATKDEILAMFNAAIQKVPQDPELRLTLINYQIANKDGGAAVDSARQAIAALPDNAAILDALGRALAVAGDSNQAIVTFNKLAQLVPTSPAAFMRIAELQWSQQKGSDAVQSLNKALGVVPDHLPAQRTLINIHLAEKNPDKAVAVARTIQRQRPKQDLGYVFEGDIELSRNQVELALRAYREGTKATGGTTDLATRTYAALLKGKQAAQAEQHAAEWLKAHPDDVAFRFGMGDLALARGDAAFAEARYRDVLKVQPENALALNNVAWLLATAKKPGALAMAEKADKLLPGRPAIMDTLALAYSAEGKPAKAVEVMQKALALDAKNPMLRLGLAKYLIQAGDKTSAKAELDSLAKLGDKFSRQNEVAELQKKL